MASKIKRLKTTKFNWKIEKFSKLNSDKGHASAVFSVGSSKWKAMIYPKGAGEVNDHLTLGLMPVGLTKSVQAEYSFAVTSQTSRSNTIKNELHHNFTENMGRGWPKFMRLSEFHDMGRGYLVNDTCVIRVEVTCAADMKQE